MCGLFFSGSHAALAFPLDLYISRNVLQNANPEHDAFTAKNIRLLSAAFLNTVTPRPNINIKEYLNEKTQTAAKNMEGYNTPAIPKNLYAFVTVPYENARNVYLRPSPEKHLLPSIGVQISLFFYWNSTYLLSPDARKAPTVRITQF